MSGVGNGRTQAASPPGSHHARSNNRNEAHHTSYLIMPPTLVVADIRHCCYVPAPLVGGLRARRGACVPAAYPHVTPLPRRWHTPPWFGGCGEGQCRGAAASSPPGSEPTGHCCLLLRYRRARSQAPHPTQPYHRGHRALRPIGWGCGRAARRQTPQPAASLRVRGGKQRGLRETTRNCRRVLAYALRSGPGGCYSVSH